MEHASRPVLPHLSQDASQRVSKLPCSTVHRNTQLRCKWQLVAVHGIRMQVQQPISGEVINVRSDLAIMVNVKPNTWLTLEAGCFQAKHPRNLNQGVGLHWILLRLFSRMP